MYLPQSGEARPIESIDELVAHFRLAGKPREAWRVGVEHEMIGIYADGSAPPFEGERGIGQLLDRVADASSWLRVYEGEHVIALARDDGQITLEPGGQLELAARPVHHIAELEQEILGFADAIAEPSRALGIAWLGVGFRPFGALQDVPWMPKGRYAIMRKYLPTRGALAHEMMKRTATVQANLDFSDVDDAGAKLRCAMSITPVLTAIYANSPIVDGQPTAYQSYRAHVWTDTDNDRSGLLPFALDDVDVFRAYTEWALDVPMFFVHRGGYAPAGGITFRKFLRDGFGHVRATIHDWELHLSTLFPEARMKRFIEIRGCDGGSRDMVLSLGPLVRALFYDDDARAAATALCAGPTVAERIALHEAVARDALRARFPSTKHTVGDLARDLIAIAADGLRRQAPDELRFLAPLERIVTERRTEADRALDAWTACNGDPLGVAAALAHPGLGF